MVVKVVFVVVGSLVVGNGMVVEVVLGVVCGVVVEEVLGVVVKVVFVVVVVVIGMAVVVLYYFYCSADMRML